MTLWPLAGAVAAVAAGIATALAAPWRAPEPLSAHPALVLAIVVGALAYCVAGFVLPAAIGSVSLRKTIRRLDRLHVSAREERPVTVGAFVDSFTMPAAQRAAEDYVATLHADAAGRFEPSAAAERFFNPLSLVERPLALPLFQPVPFLLFAVTAAAALFGTVAALDAYAAAVAIEPGARALGVLASGLSETALALALGVAGGLAALALLRITVGLRESQAECLASVVDILFDRIANAFTLRRLADSLHEEAADTRMTVRMQTDDLAKRIDRMADRVSDALVRQQTAMASVLADAVASAFERPAALLAEAAAETARDRTAETESVLERALAAHGDAMDRQTAERADEIRRLLDETQGLVADVREGFADLAARLGELTEALSAGTAASADLGQALMALSRELSDEDR